LYDLKCKSQNTACLNGARDPLDGPASGMHSDVGKFNMFDTHCYKNLYLEE